MKLIFSIIIFIILLVCICSIYLLCRNEMVYRYKVYKLYNSTIKEYMELPSYEYMLFNIFYKLEIPNE